ncbi:MAG: enoyl-[acyl-carrier-protein] reductase FabK [Actinomycetota bacterium]|nr:enoyl-[acyl-carrier-protein] reductase FabK [Actinomycetota bacterium]
MDFRTEICDLLGIEFPIIQGGMAWVATAELAAAVSNAGGLGIIGAGHMPAAELEREILKAKELTDKPFGVNLMLLAPHVDELFKVVLKEEVPIVTTGAGNPGRHMPALKERNIKVLPVCASVVLAQRLEGVGADAIIAEGMEAGGHIGDLTTMVLVPQVVDVVNIPVIAAGGIADGRGLAAALALGAKGVQMGTRFMCAEECIIHPNVKGKVVKARNRDTVVTGYSTGHPVRVLKNKLAKQFQKMDAEGRGEDLEKMGVGKLRLAMREGDVEWGSVMAGQCAGLIHEIKSAREIISDIVTEARRVLTELSEC